ncbi:MAG TPA: GreA/GreB family elongation factor [Polyangiaceae bacterium]|jgi:transcription elongation GreA/GreB family factor
MRSKADLRKELVARLAADLETLESALRATIQGATHEEAKPENDKDTRALEQSYLARGQAQRVDELRLALAETESLFVRDFADSPAALGALVVVDEDGRGSWLFLAPAGGGAHLADGKVQVVTPRSPLGQAVLGKRAGDEVEVTIAGRRRTLHVVDVR